MGLLARNDLNRHRKTLYAPTQQNGQTYTKNSSTAADEFLSVFDQFVGSALKWLIIDSVYLGSYFDTFVKRILS